MDRRAMILAHLAEAERHLAEDEVTIDRQLNLVAELERDGAVQAAQTARALLIQLRHAQALHVADRERLRQALADLGA